MRTYFVVGTVCQKHKYGDGYKVGNYIHYFNEISSCNKPSIKIFYV